MTWKDSTISQEKALKINVLKIYFTVRPDANRFSNEILGVVLSGE